MNTSTDPFPTVFIAFLVAHYVGDYWLQTEAQAMTKGERGLLGWLAAASHVATYTLATAVFVAGVWLLFGLHITAVGFVVGQAISAGTHVVIDRRWTLRWVVEHVAPWDRTFYDDVPGGAEKLDQAAHVLFLFVAALVTAVVQ